MDCLLALDAGTGSGRCVAFDPEGNVVASAQEPFSYHIFTDPVIPMIRGFDLDADAFWGALARCARAVVGRLPPGARIRGVIATAQREGCVFLDADGGVLYAGPNLDARASMEGMEVVQTCGAERLHAITGHAPPYIFAIARWVWFRKHHDAAPRRDVPHAERLDHVPALRRAGRRAFERGRVDALRRHPARVVVRDPGCARHSRRGPARGSARRERASAR